MPFSSTPPRLRAPARLLPSLLAGALLSACAQRLPIETALQGKATGIQAHHDSSGYSVVIQSGNLLDSAIFSAEERSLLLQDFINTYRSKFGVPDAGPVSFVPAGGEFDFEFQGRTLTGVKLQQAVNGVRILEAEQLGLFDLQSGVMTAVSVRLADAGNLKGLVPPASSEGIPALASQFLESSGMTADSLTVIEGPAYSLALKMSGYEVRCTADVGAEMPALIRLLVNPDTRVVAFLSRRRFH